MLKNVNCPAALAKKTRNKMSTKFTDQFGIVKKMI